MTWTFWVMAAALTAAAAAVLLRPLLRRSQADDDTLGVDHDIQVYRDQLAEVDRELERGVLRPGEAHAARIEIKRRLLATDARRTPARRDRSPLRGSIHLVAFSLVVLLPAIGLGGYLVLGSPDLPSRPIADRGAELAERQELHRLAEGLRARLERSPEDPRGWQMLGRSYVELGRWSQAAEAYRKAVLHGGEGAELRAALGEAVVAANDGVITPEARAAFDMALAQDPDNVRARFYLAEAKEQAGRRQEALEDWLALAADTPADAPWRPLLTQRIARAAEGLGMRTDELDVPGGRATPSGPSAADMQAVEDMSPEEREAFVRSMVDRLDDRLAENPDDLDGWLRLLQVRLVLGDEEEARQALARARVLSEPLDDADPRRRAVNEASRLLGED